MKATSPPGSDEKRLPGQPGQGFLPLSVPAGRTATTWWLSRRGQTGFAGTAVPATLSRQNPSPAGRLRITLTLETPREDRDRSIRRLRAALKALARSYGLRCTYCDFHQEPPAQPPVMPAD